MDAHRKNLGKPIAYGRTAEIYAWQQGWVLKLFYDWFDLQSIEYEARLSQAIYSSGLPVPAVGEILQVKGRNGLIYERVDGISMWDDLAQNPWKLYSLACKTAALHAQMHAIISQAHFPRQRQCLVEKIRRANAIPADLQRQALEALDELPDGDRLCHGDFHPGNILITSQGEVIIDWIDATGGNPLADLARTTILARGAVACQMKGLQKPMVSLFHAIYIRQYFKLRPGGETEYQQWLPLVAAARLSENIQELEGWLLQQAKNGFPERE